MAQRLPRHTEPPTPEELEQLEDERVARRKAAFHLQATQLVDALQRTLALMQQQQRSLFVEGTRTVHATYQFASELAFSLYQTGLYAYPVTRLHDMVSEGELQALLYCFLCHDTQERLITLAQRWITRSHTRYGPEHDYTTQSVTHPEDTLSPVPSRRSRLGNSENVPGRRNGARSRWGSY